MQPQQQSRPAVTPSLRARRVPCASPRRGAGAGRRALALLSLVVAAAAAPGCGETAVELRLNLNVKVPDELDSLCLSAGPVGATSFARQYPITEGGAAQTLVVLPGDQASDRFEVIVGSELRRQLFDFERRVIDFVSGEVTSSELSVGGRCSAGASGSGVFEQQPRRITDVATPTVIAAMPAPGHPALVLASALGGGPVPRFAFLASENTVVSLEDQTPTVAGPIKRLLTFDLQGGSADRVCARDFVALTDSGVELWQNRGAGSFDKSTPPNGVGGGFVDGVARDFDGDGITDLALVAPSELALLFGTSDGSFVRRVASEPTGLTNLTSIAAGFFDDPAGGGRTPDLVLGRANGQKDLVLLNRSGDGNFSAASSQVEIGDAKDTVSVAAVRSNGDGYDDIASSDGTAVYLFAQDPQTQQLKAVGLPGGIDGADVARLYGVDVDGDCLRDLVLLRSEGSGKKSTVLLFDRGSGGYSAAAGVLPAGRELLVVDFDGDGVRDVILASSAGGTELYRQLPAQATP